MKKLLFLLCILLLSHALIREEDLLCSDRESPFTKLIGESAGDGQLNSAAILNKNEEILLCGSYTHISTKGIIASSSMNGTLNWGYALHMPCEFIYVDDKEAAIYSILFIAGTGLEVHSYSADDSLDRNYMYALDDVNIASINDATINGDFNWALVTMNDNSCYMIMITKIRRKSYKCSTTVSMKSFRFINSDPLVIGNDAAGVIYSTRLYSDRFEIKWQRKIEGATSTDMFLYDSNDSSDTSNALAVFITDPDNYPMIVRYDFELGTILEVTVFEYAMTSPKILYSSTQKDYILTGEIAATNQMVFVRFSESLQFGDLRASKENNQALYKLVPGTVTLDKKANLILGGQAIGNKFFYYMTGEELSAYSCVLKDSTRVPRVEISKSEKPLTLTPIPGTSTDGKFFTLINDASNAQWDNKTGRIFGYDTSLTSSSYCTPSLNSHWIKPLYVPNRYSLRFSNICSGSTNKKEDLSSLSLSLTSIETSSKNAKKNPKLVIEGGSIDIVTTHLAPSEYTYALRITPKSNPSDGFVEIAFDYKVERNIFMEVMNIGIYLMMAFVVLDCLVNGEYKIIRYFIFSLQFMHFIGMLDVKSPPSSIFFLNAISLSSFTNVWLTRTMMEQPMETESVSFFNAGLETRHSMFIIPSQILFISLIFIILIGVYYLLKCKIISFKDEQRSLAIMNKIKKNYWKSIIEFIWEVQFPYLLLISLYEIINFNTSAGIISIFSLIFTVLILMLNIIVTTILQVTNLQKLFEKYVDKDTMKKVSYKIFFLVRRIMIVSLLLLQSLISSFETAFIMFTINSMFVCINMKYTQNRKDFLYYCISEIPVVVFGFITISFTSYNLDVYGKQKISLIGIFVIIMVYISFFSFRIHDIIQYYKTKKNKKEDPIKRDTTNQNMMKEPYQSEAEVDNGIENIRENLRKQLEDQDTPRSVRRNVSKRNNPPQKEEYKF